MLDLARYEGRHRIRGSLYLAVAMALLAAMVVWIYPSFSDTFEGDELLEAYPPEVLQLFDVQTMGSLEGFLGFELYVFGWVIMLGLYLAYLGAGTIADDVERERMDVLLSMPISRARVVGETFGSLAVPIVVVNLLTPVVVYGGSILIDESIDLADVLAVHLLSIPYLSTCAAIGLLASVVADRAGIAQRVALGVTFGLFLLDSVLEGSEYEDIGVISPARYYDPNEILIEGTYDLVSAGVLLAMTVGLVLVSILWFRRRDL